MKRIGICANTIALLVFLAFPALAHAERQVTTLALGWKFIRHGMDIADSVAGWDDVVIPHTWNAVDGQTGSAPIRDENQNPMDATQAAAVFKTRTKPGADPHMKNGYHQGACWHAKTLAVPAEWKGKKRVFIRFEAACVVAKTYLNQRILGEHRGAFTAFAYELAPI